MTDNEIFNFFATADNMTVALEIEKRVRELKDHAQFSFWTAFNSTFDLKLKSSEYAPSWKFQPFPIRRLKKGWDGCRVTSIANSPSHADVVFGQMGPEAGYTIYWGVMKTGEFVDTSAMITLKTKLSALKINNVWWNSWIAGGAYMYRIYQPEFLQRMVNNPDILVNEIVSDFWNLFLEIRPTIELIHQENLQAPK